MVLLYMKSNNKLENFIKALDRLKEGLLQYDNEDELQRDGIIQRYEFTFELAWKTLKEVFEDEGLVGLNSPKTVLREAYSSGLIDDEKIWLDMLVDRNATSHIYSQSNAIEICKRIKEIYIYKLEGLKDKILERLNQI